jgi:hypothetical protein
VPLRLYDGLQLLVDRFAITEKQAPVTFLVDTGSGSMWLETTNNRKQPFKSHKRPEVKVQKITY